MGWKAWHLPVCVMSVLLGTSATLAGPSPKVSILAYINVSSGCQQATVERLRAFQKKHPKEVTLEIVDFGSEEGRVRWQNDGYQCQEIFINGSDQFRLGSGARARIVVLKMPEGVRWTFEDLDAILTRELRAPHSTVLSDEEAKKLALTLPVSSRPGTWKGKPVGEVVVGAQVVFRYCGSLSGKSPLQRARDTAVTLKRLYKEGLSAEEVHVARANSPSAPQAAILARDEVIATISKCEADIILRPPVAAAQTFAMNIRDALRLLGR